MDSKDFKFKNAFYSSLPISIFLFVIAVILAYYEVQIEGPNGWASSLPTWKSTDPKITWIFGGRPVTGYHVSLNLILLLFFHWPIIFRKWSIIFEAKTMASYALLSTIWDFLWFVINPYFGLSKYSSENIWWFSNWFLGIPVDYYFGFFITLLIRCIPSIFKKEPFIKSFSEGLFFIITSIFLVFLFSLIYQIFN